jgi:hypothetical protein
MVYNTAHLRVPINITADVDHAQFQITIDSAETGRDFYIWAPTLAPGRGSDVVTRDNNPFRELYGTAAPAGTTGYELGQKVHNTLNEGLGPDFWELKLYGGVATWMPNRITATAVFNDITIPANNEFPLAVSIAGALPRMTATASVEEDSDTLSVTPHVRAGQVRCYVRNRTGSSVGPRTIVVTATVYG